MFTGVCQYAGGKWFKEKLKSLGDSAPLRAQERCESRGGRPGLLVSVEVKQH